MSTIAIFIFFWTGLAIWTAAAFYGAARMALSLAKAVVAIRYVGKFRASGFEVVKHAKGLRGTLGIWWFCYSTDIYTLKKMLARDPASYPG